MKSGISLALASLTLSAFGVLVALFGLMGPEMPGMPAVMNNASWIALILAPLIWFAAFVVGMFGMHAAQGKTSAFPTIASGLAACLSGLSVVAWLAIFAFFVFYVTFFTTSF